MRTNHYGIVQKTVPVFNLIPAQGEPARFGFEVLGKIPVVIDTGVKSGEDYGVVVSVKDATQTAGLLSSQVTLWGDPGDPRHNASRGWECVAGGAFAGQVEKSCPASSAEPETAFLRLPTSCAADPAAEPFVTRMSTDAWTDPGVFLGAEYAWLSDAGEPLGFTGCEQEPFTPQVVVVPVQHAASTPTGLSVDVKVPQSSTVTPGQIAEADVRDTTVTLPEGVKLSPSAANGLEACSEEQVGFTGFNQALQINEFDTSQVSCPDGSKLGTVRIKTPLLENELKGFVYLASPAPNGEAGRNPFNSLVALYLVAEDPVSGVLVKLAGEGQTRTKARCAYRRRSRTRRRSLLKICSWNCSTARGLGEHAGVVRELPDERAVHALVDRSCSERTELGRRIRCELGRWGFAVSGERTVYAWVPGAER